MSDDSNHKHGKSCGCRIHHGFVLIAIRWPEAVGDDEASQENGKRVVKALDSVVPALVEAMPEGASLAAPGAETLMAITEVAPAHVKVAKQQEKAAKSARLN